MKHILQWILAVAILGTCAVAQDESRQPGTTPAPAFGQTAPVLNPENPPVSGLDEPWLDLRTASRSFIAPALQLTETADTNAGNQFRSHGVESVTRVLGALDLQRFWAKTDFLAEYLGGGAVYSTGLNVKQMHAVGAEIVDRWRTGQVTLRDSFSYLPEGSFSFGAYGGMPGLGLANGGGMGTGEAGGGLPGSRDFGTGQLGSIGLIPRIANTVIADMVQSITPRTAVTLAGGFSNAHFYDDANLLVNSDQTTVQGGFSHLLSRHDQVGAIYGYQLFRFPQITGGQIQNHIVNLRWGHTITGRLSLIVGAGPQYTVVQLDYPTPFEQKQWSANGRVQLRYKLRRTAFVLAYEKYVSSGSGFYTGADSQVARLGMKHSISRTVDFFGDLGYSHNKRLGTINNLLIPFLGAAGEHYDEGFAGAVVRKHFGRVFDFFVAYRFGEIGFDVQQDMLCGIQGLTGPCGRISSRNSGTIGVEWHPTPKRIE
jgi:hypothetical protein